MMSRHATDVVQLPCRLEVWLHIARDRANFSDLQADSNGKNWKADFYGPNYIRLVAIKAIHDPNNLL